MDPKQPLATSHDFSYYRFLACIFLILAGFLAFPLYQAIQTGGVVFYANGIDESSYLSYPYAQYVTKAFGSHRLSSVIVLWLHEHGISGGLCNVLFDVTTTIGIILGLYRLLLILDYGRSDARRGAILIFLLPLLFSPTNPVFDALRWAYLSDSLIQWVVGPFNLELPFARTPEPQLSWLLLIAWLNLFARTRFVPMALVAITPLLYSFIRLPVLFVGIATLASSRWRLPYRLLFAWILVGISMALFLNPTALGSKGSSQVGWIFIRSWLPMISVMGITSLGIFAFIRHHAPASLTTILPVLVASTWIGPNIQVISGSFAAPVNYEQYWSNVIVAFLATVAILARSQRKNLWVATALCIFVIQSAQIFASNLRVFRHLEEPRVALATLRESAELVAVSDLHLAAYLDLAYPTQPATVFSFANTYDISSDYAYERYLCARRFIEASHPEIAPSFAALFAKLDYGYQVRGIDPLATAGRADIKKRDLTSSASGLVCTEPPPIVLRTPLRETR